MGVYQAWHDRHSGGINSTDIIAPIGLFDGISTHGRYGLAFKQHSFCPGWRTRPVDYIAVNNKRTAGHRLYHYFPIFSGR